jgi:hypothetical protein
MLFESVQPLRLSVTSCSAAFGGNSAASVASVDLPHGACAIA